MPRKPQEAKQKPEQKRPQDIGAKAKPFIDRMEHLDAEMKGYRAEIAESKKIILEEVEAAGIQPKAFKKILRMRKLQQQLAELPEKLDDIDARAQFAALAEAFGDSPFGEFARSMAEAGATVSVHLAPGTAPTVIHPDDAEMREDEAYLDRIGRGRPAGDDIDDLAR